MGVLAVVAAGGLLWYWQRAEPGISGSPGRAAASTSPSSDAAAAPGANAEPARTTTTPNVAASAERAAADPGVDASVAAVGVPDAGATVIARIRDSVIRDPKRAEELAVEDQKRFPNSPDADERDALLVSALLNQRQLDHARVEARRYFKLHPGGAYTDYLIRETDMRPSPAAASR